MAQVLEHEKESAWLNSKGPICDWLGGVAHQHGRWLQDLWSCCCHQAVDAWLLIVEPVAMLVEVPIMTGLISGNIFLLVMNLHDKIINYIYLYIFTQGLIYIYIYLCIYIYIAQENLGYERFCASGIPLPPELTSLLVPRTCLWATCLRSPNRFGIASLTVFLSMGGKVPGQDIIEVVFLVVSMYLFHYNDILFLHFRVVRITIFRWQSLQ